MSSLYAARNSNLSLAWAEVFLKLMERGVNKLSPVVVTVGEFDAASLPVEHDAVREALDTIIDQSCRTVASTIFPNSLWLPAAQDDAQLLYDRYAKVWPRVAKHHSNRNGVYFRRLTAYLPKTAIRSAPAIDTGWSGSKTGGTKSIAHITSRAIR